MNGRIDKELIKLGEVFKSIAKKILYGPFAPVASFLFRVISDIEYAFFEMKWKRQGWKKPNQEEIDFVCQNVTVIFKSFERQKMAKRLYKNLQSYYPGIHVVIADDSTNPLDLKGGSLEVIQLPFNSGLSYGLNCALEKVETPYVLRMDDDELLTLKTCLGRQLQFLNLHQEVDLVGFCTLTAIRCMNPDEAVSAFTAFSMKDAPKPLCIPHMTQIDGNHFVLGKVPNLFLVRTDKLRSIGWDDNIRMIDHQDFFWRAAGNLVSVIALGTAVFHYHNPFHRHYQKYRQDVERDKEYIKKKRIKNLNCK